MKLGVLTNVIGETPLKEALAYFKEHDRIYREAVEEYSRNYGPLTLSHAHHCGSYWNWVNQPWPWQ